MAYPNQKADPANKGRPYLEEADIGSGEKNPGQLETEEMIRQIPPLPPCSEQADPSGALQRGECVDDSQSSPDSPSDRQALRP